MKRPFILAGATGLLALVVSGTAAAAEPFLDQVNIFEAGTGGYAHYRVPAIVVSARGTVLAFAEARKSTRGDWGAQDIVMRRSTDGGRTWTPPRVVARVNGAAGGAIQPNPVAVSQNLDQPGEPTYNNVVPITDRKSGALHLLFCVEYARCYAMHSQDDGETFSDAFDITPVFEQFREEYDWKVIATGPGHGIQLERGRLLVPVWLSDGSGGHAHRPSIVAVVYSDDHGETWRRGQVVVRHPKLKNPSETVAVELADGRVMFNIRNESPEHRRAVSYSEDGVSGWTEPEFHEELREPVCMASVVRLSAQPRSSRNRILFANPHSSEPRDPNHPEGSHKRQNLTIKLSYDEGRTWPVAKSLEPGVSGYSDLAAGPDGTIYCIYERGSAREGGVQFLTVARFNLEWLTGGRDGL
jgi:sialidase-1